MRIYDFKRPACVVKCVRKTGMYLISALLAYAHPRAVDGQEVKQGIPIMQGVAHTPLYLLLIKFTEVFFHRLGRENPVCLLLKQ